MIAINIYSFLLGLGIYFLIPFIMPEKTNKQVLVITLLLTFGILMLRAWVLRN